MVQPIQPLLKKIADFLIQGNYQISTSQPIAFLKSAKNTPVVKQFIPKNDSFAVCVAGKTRPSFQGNCVYFTINGGAKIFSADGQEVMVLFKDQESYTKSINNNASFSPYFTLPKILQTWPKENRLLEEYIPFRKMMRADRPYVLKTIAKDYLRYFLDYQTREEVLRGQLENKPSADAIQYTRIIQHISSEIRHTEYPFLPLHGDLWTGNLLVRDTFPPAVTYIDWETAGRYIFFYDLFKFMWNELDVYGDTQYYISYLKGAYDEYFHKIFSAFDLTYREDCRKDYFYIFILNYLLENESGIPSQVKYSEINDFLDKIGGIFI